MELVFAVTLGAVGYFAFRRLATDSANRNPHVRRFEAILGAGYCVIAALNLMSATVNGRESSYEISIGCFSGLLLYVLVNLIIAEFVEIYGSKPGN